MDAGRGPRSGEEAIPMSKDDAKARAQAVFRSPVSAPVPALESDADAARAKMARLKALREAREKAESERAEIWREKARRARKDRP